MKQVHVFKTNISTFTQSKLVKTVLGTHPQVEQWSVDMEDVDCVLRVVTQSLRPKDIIQLITLQGFQCVEL